MADETPAAVVPAEARGLGHDPVSVEVALVPRTTGWRLGRAARWWVAGAVLAPVLGVLPPHAPWALAAGAGGVVLGLRKWGERYTLVRLRGSCPRCGEGLAFDGATPLKLPHRVSCDACGNPVVLHLDGGALPA